MRRRPIRVELIYDAGCPNVAATRSLLIQAFTKTGGSARWHEWERSDQDVPAYVKEYGSPTILVDGKDISGVKPGAGDASCRVYQSEAGCTSRTPTLEMISRALVATQEPVGSGRLRAVAASVPTVGAALLPKLTCPLCWPAYTAALSALGLGFVDYSPYLLPATLLFLAIALGPLAWKARRGGRPSAFIAGLVAAAMVLLGKFALDANWMTNVGVVLLVGAVFFAGRPRVSQQLACPACRSDARPAATRAH